MLELLLYRVLESIGLDVQARRVFRRLLRVHQLIVDRFHMIADCRAGKGQHPGVQEPRKSRRPFRQRLTAA